MTSMLTAFLLADPLHHEDLFAPHTSSDNPYSEAQFKTLNYRRGFPSRFGSIEGRRPSAASSSLGTTSNTARSASANDSVGHPPRTLAAPPR